MNIEFQFVREDTRSVVARGVWAGRIYYSNIAKRWVYSRASNMSAFSDAECAEIRQATRKMEIVLDITTRLKGGMT